MSKSITCSSLTLSRYKQSFLVSLARMHRYGATLCIVLGSAVIQQQGGMCSALVSHWHERIDMLLSSGSSWNSLLFAIETILEKSEDEGEICRVLMSALGSYVNTLSSQTNSDYYYAESITCQSQSSMLGTKPAVTRILMCPQLRINL